MRDLHVTAEVLDRFARGDLDEARLSEVLEHLENCDACASAGKAHAANDLAALRAEMTSFQPLDDRRDARRAWTIAAAAAIAIAMLSVLLLPRRGSPPGDPGRLVIVPPPVTTTTTTVTTRDDHRYHDPEWQRAVEDTLKNGRLPFPKDLAELRAPADILRGGSGGDEQVAPAGVVVDDVRPPFTWPAREGGTYTVFVFADDRKVIQSPPLKQATWTPDRDLPRGRTLAWQVEATGPGIFETIPSPPSPPATFRIVKETDHRDLNEARARHGDDDLLLAVLYARSGMKAEALQALRLAAADDPNAKKILERETSLSP